MIPPTVISLSQSPHLADGRAAFLQGGSGNGEGEKRRSNKGKKRDRGDEDEDKDDKQGKNNKDPGGGREKMPGDGNLSGSPEISFHIVSKVNPTQNGQEVFQTLMQDGPLATFQTLTMKGTLTIQVLLYLY